MFEVRGKYATARVYATTVEQEAISQIQMMCNQVFAKDQTIAIMADTHAGKGCTIGTTMTITDKVVPNLVGVDIACGMCVVKLGKIDVSTEVLEKLDKVIRKYIPSGMNVRKTRHTNGKNVNLQELRCIHAINIDRAYLSLGTLGGGNHFQELEKSEKTGDVYFVVHTGSRYLGKQVAEYYQNLAAKVVNSNKKEIENIVADLKVQGREREIEETLRNYTKVTKAPKGLEYLEGQYLEDYIHDIKIVNEFSNWNRQTIVEEVTKRMGWEIEEMFTTLHNYIDTENMILRKGAVSAQEGEKLLIPINMRDGALLCVGKGNKAYNCSAPHGAGRLMSRSKAKQEITMEEYEETMKGIYTTSVGEGTLDEAPQAYKPIDEILENITDTVEVLDIIKPIYNYKASEDFESLPEWKKEVVRKRQEKMRENLK